MRLQRGTPCRPARRSDAGNAIFDLFGALRNLCAANGHVNVLLVERSAAPTRANHKKALLSNLFAHGVLLGLRNDNLAKSARPPKKEPRTEAPDPELLARFLH